MLPDCMVDLKTPHDDKVDLIFFFFEIFLTVRFISSSSHFRVTNMILCYHQFNDSFFFLGFSCNK